MSPRRFDRAALAALLLVASGPLPVASGAAPPCSCTRDVDRLAARLEADYVGFRLGVERVGRIPAWRSAVESIRRASAGASDERCLELLRRLAGWLHDPHVFVAELPDPPADTVTVASGLDPDSVSRDLHRRAALDPIEGIWYSRGDRVAIVRRPDLGPGWFTAVVLTTSWPHWRPGDLRAEFRRDSAGAYRAVLRVADGTLRHVTGEIYKRLLLRMPPFMWGRAFPLRPGEEGLVDTLDPRRPTLMLPDARTAVISIPSHDPSYQPVLDSLLARHEDALVARDRLVVDLRGDEGGSSLATEGLMPYLWTRTRRPPIGPAGPAVVLSSPDNLRLFEKMGWIPAHVLAAMRTHPGSLVPFPLDTTRDDSAPPDLHTNPTRVAILIDRGVVSAGEAFLLRARRFSRVTVFGQPTGGSIDYQNVRLIAFTCSGRPFYLGYPTIAASAALPAAGLNRNGIPPDVRIGPRVDDWIRFALDHLDAAGEETRGR